MGGEGEGLGGENVIPLVFHLTFSVLHSHLQNQ